MTLKNMAILYNFAKHKTINELVSSPDRHALWVKDGLQQLLLILGPGVKHLFYLKGTYIINQRSI